MANGTQSMTELREENDRLRRARERDSAEADVVGARGRVAIGFAGAYVGTRVLRTLAPGLASMDTVVNLGVGGYGAYVAFTDDDESGDYWLGAALSVAPPLLDKAVEMVGTAVQKFQGTATGNGG